MDLVIQNPWWKNKEEIEKDEKVREALKRKIKVIYELKDKKNKIILGPRQVGKTSMIKLIIYDLIINKSIEPLDILYFSCEPLKDKNDIIEVVKEFLKISQKDSFKYVFLDEVTQIDDWELAIKFILETNFGKEKMIIATGSNASLLKRGVERLPGRNISIELFLPLTFREFLLKFGSEELKQKLLRKKIETFNINEIEKAEELKIFFYEIETKFNFYMKTGGYLKAIYELLETDRISEVTYETYIKWILGDLNKLNRKEHIFKSILIGIIKNYGTKFSLHSIARETEIKTHVSAADYLDILQSLLLTNQIYQIDYNKKIPLFRKEKKNYFIDPFFFSVCNGYINGKYQDYSEEIKEKIVEGIVCEALSRKVRTELDTSSSLWFYTKEKETDFVLKQKKELIGIEVKWQNKVDKRDFNNFKLFKKRVLLSKKDFKIDKKNDFVILPVFLFLALI